MNKKIEEKKMFAVEFKLKLSSMFSIRLPYSYQAARTYPLPAPSTIKGLLANAVWQQRGGNPVSWLEMVNNYVVGATSRAESKIAVISCMVRIIPQDALLRQFAFTPHIDCLVVFASERIGRDVAEALESSPIYLGDSESLATVLSVSQKPIEPKMLKSGEPISVNTLVLEGLAENLNPEQRPTPLYMQEDPIDEKALIERYLAPLTQDGDTYIPLSEINLCTKKECIFVKGERLYGLFRRPEDRPKPKQKRKREDKIRILHLTLQTEEKLKPEEAVGIRGCLGRRFEDKAIFHHHKEDGLVYSYPLIQYKVLDGKTLIIGIREGVDALMEHKDQIDSLWLFDRTVKVKERLVLVKEKKERFSITKEPIHYTFLTPWLALNQENYREWQVLSKKDKQEKLKKILIGNILSMAKGLEYVVTDEIKVDLDVRSVQTALKGVPMVGFLGNFSVNFAIPDYLGLGKSVSRGFGTVRRTK